MKEKPTIDVRCARFACMSEEEKSQALFAGRFTIVGNVEAWAAQNKTLYQRLLSLAVNQKSESET